MRRIALWLMTGASLCAQVRYARLGEIDGSAEMQLHPSQPWKPALRNTPLLESSWLRTGGASPEDFDVAVNWLVAEGVMTRDGKRYNFAVPMFWSWLVRNMRSAARASALGLDR